MSDLFNDLKRLSEMRAAGEITEAEYEVVKQELLAEIERETDTGDETRDPGWYNDPDGVHSHQAYWDGKQWTGETRPGPGQSVSTGPQTKPPIYKRPWVIVIAAILGLGLIGSALEQDEDITPITTTAGASTPTSEQLDEEPIDTTIDEERPSTTVTTQVATELTVPGTLAIEPDEFQNNWNRFIDESGLENLRMPPVQVEEGAVQDVFTVSLSSRLSVLGTVNKADGTIRDVQVFGTPTEDFAENTDLILSWAALIAAVDPTMEASQRGEILEDLGIVGGDEWAESGYEAEVTANGVRYKFNNFLDGLGTLSFNAGDPAD